MRLCVLVAYTPDNGPWSELAAIVLPRLHAYCDRHGYGLQILEGAYGNGKRHYPWQRTEWARDAIAKCDSDAAWVLDIDTLITNPDIPVAQFLDDQHDLFIGQEVNAINAGSYLIRKGPWASRWFEALLALQGISTSENHGILMMHEIPEWRDRTKIVEGINSIPYGLYPHFPKDLKHSSQWEEGHLLVHLPGMTPQARVDIFREHFA